MNNIRKVTLACVMVAFVLVSCTKQASSAPAQATPAAPQAQKVADEREIKTCFVPGENCTQFVVDAIRLTKGQGGEILLQAYNYTSPPILGALAKAKEAGSDVRVILDKSNEQERYTGATYTKNHGIPVLIDDKVAIAHNKVIIIDGKHVLSGSFNFTESAQKKNAENVILIMNDPELAKRYIANWHKRESVSREYAGK